MNSTISPLFDLAISRYRLPFVTRVPLNIYLMEPIIRSAFGFVLKERFCVFSNFRNISCDSCSHIDHCVYTTIFSPRASIAKKQQRTKRLVHPPRFFTLSVTSHKWNLEAGDKGFVDLTLLGDKAFEYKSPILESITHAISTMDSFKLKNRISDEKAHYRPLIPENWECCTPANCEQISSLLIKSDTLTEGLEIVYTLDRWITALLFSTLEKLSRDISTLQLTLVTPLQSKHQKKGNFFPDLLRSIISRLRDLKRAYHEDNDMDDSLTSDFFKAAKKVSVSSNLNKKIESVYSFRQQEQIYLSGLKGTVLLKGDLKPFLSFLSAATLIGVGSKTTYGLGRIEIFR